MANPFTTSKRRAAVLSLDYNPATKTAFGKAPAGASVAVKLAGAQVASVVATADGAWTHTLAADPDGALVSAEVPATAVPILTPKKLPARPFAVGARVAAIGDSQLGYSNTFGGPVSTANKAAYSTGYGFLAHAKMIDSRFRFENWFDLADPRGLNYVGANQGLHGDHMEWVSQPAFLGGIVARLPAVLARRPDILVLDGGYNSLHSGDDMNGQPAPASYVIGKLDKALRLARFAGVWTILVSIYPAGAWPAGDARYTELAKVAAWCKAQVGRDGLLAVMDCDDLLAPGGILDATMFRSDKVHLSVKGALAVARQKFLPIVQAAVSAGSTFDKDPTINNLFPAATYNLPGTTGIKQQNGVTNGAGSPTGNVATGLTLNIGRNCTVVASKNIIAASSLEEQVMAITPGGSQSNNYAELTLSGLTVMEAADPAIWYQAFLEVETSGDGLTFATLQGGLRNGASVVTQTTTLQRESSADFAAGDGGGARTFWLQTEPFRSDGTAYDRVALSLFMTFSKTAAPFTIRARKPIIRRVADPRAAWGY